MKTLTLEDNICVSRLLTRFQLGLENLEDGKAAREKEYVWYGRLTDLTQLGKVADKETQKQSTVKGKGGTIRVRETITMGQVRYTLTAKAYSGRGDAQEVSLPVSKDLHDIFKAISGESMDKIRYTIPIENIDPVNGQGLKWEVDVFIDANGNPKEWVKIDLEVPGETSEWPPLPVKLEDMIFGGNEDYTPEQRAKLDELQATVFVNKL